MDFFAGFIKVLTRHWVVRETGKGRGKAAKCAELETFIHLHLWVRLVTIGCARLEGVYS